MGILYVVATPIGNLADITLRALEILKSVDLIVSEDTRETDKILKHYKIETPQISYRDQNHDRVLPQILAVVQEEKDVALTSDSGTPLISDPGFKLVQALKVRNIQVVSIPGPTAVTAALSVSGLPTDKFVFLGFLPKKKGQRAALLKKYGTLDATLTIYESPYKVFSLVEQILEVLGDRTICLAKDVTKKFEVVETKKASEFLSYKGEFKPKGEYVVLVAKEGYEF